MKEKLLILIIALVSMFTVAYATTIKNAGSAVLDTYAGDTAFRIDFDTSTPVTNAEVDFHTPPQQGWRTDCVGSNPSLYEVAVSSDFTHMNLYPIPPLANLLGAHIYVICTEQVVQGR